MADVAEIVAPVFGLVLLGFAAARLGFPAGVSRWLSAYVFSIAVPALLVRALAEAELPADVPWRMFAAYYAPVYALYVTGWLVARFGMRRGPGDAAIFAMGCGFGNMVLLGLPLVLRAFGEAGSLPYMVILSVHGLGLMGITAVLLEVDRGRGRSRGRTALRVARGVLGNPIIFGLALGLLLNLFDVPLPVVVVDVCRGLQWTVLPCALFAMGATLARYGFAGHLAPALFLVAVNGIALPALVWLLAGPVFGLDPLWVAVATLCAAQPVGVNVYLFAQRYGCAEAVATSAVFLATASSLITLPAVLWLVRP